jgi:hypothetical protein
MSEPNTILKYNDTLWIDFISVTDWVCIADGSEVDLGILLRVGRSNILLAYTPDINTTPDTNYIQNVYTSGNIFITTKNQAVWVKVPNPNFPATISGETVYNVLGTEVQPVGYEWHHRWPITTGMDCSLRFPLRF